MFRSYVYRYTRHNRDILRRFLPNIEPPPRLSGEGMEPFIILERGLCVVVDIAQNHDSTTTSNVFCRKIDSSGRVEGKTFQLQNLGYRSFWKNEDVTNKEFEVGCILEYHSQTCCEVFRGRYSKLFIFCREVCCEPKVNFTTISTVQLSADFWETYIVMGGRHHQKYKDVK